MNKLIYILIPSCLIVVVCAFIFVPVSQFPAPDGPYGVGYVKYHWIDKARQELNVQDPEHPNRELMAYVFYPTDKNHQGERVGYNSDQINGYIGLMSYLSGFPSWLFGGVHFLKTHSQLNVPIAKADSKFPVVIVSHGWGAQLHGWTWFCELLASNGYFVVGISHPYVAEITRYLDNRVVKTLVFKKAAERKQEGGEERYRAWKADQVEICAQDMSSVITKLEELNVQGSEFWSSKIDLNKIGVMGGSFGGTTSVRACRNDSRISCGINMDGCLRGDDVTAKLLKPFMIMLAEQSNQWVDDRGIKDLDNINAFINRSENNIEKVTFKNLGHAAFSDAPIILNSTLFTRIFSRYFDFIGTSNPAEAPSVGTLCKEMGKINSRIVGFFDKNLRKSMIQNNGQINGTLITLKPLREQFFEEYHHMFSPTVRQAVGLPPTSELQDTSNFLKAAISDPQHLMFYCIFDNQTNKLIGSVVIRSSEHPNGQLGAWVNENFWGGGRYQEALYLALKKYFESTEYSSIFAFVEISNERSLRAHQKIGFEIVTKSPDDKNRLQGKQSYKIVLTRTAFDKTQKRFEGTRDADK